ncbi:MAG: hypothetical protein J6K55_04935 [Clostridia bacterium]|nr:hypothetical protein [Clostridia bacterium]
MSDAYVKTYKPLALWLAVFLASLAAVPLSLVWFIPESILTPAMLCCIYLGILALFILIHRGGYVYWINGGPSFEEARDADESLRRAYAWAHLKRFLAAGAALVPYLVLSSVFNWPTWLDIIIFGAAVIAAALSTVNIRFAPRQEETK